MPARTVLENVFLGRWANTAGFARRRDDRRRFTDLLAITGFDLDPSERVDRLSIGAQQQVEILRALGRGARVIAMDEPTAVLAEHEKRNLLDLIRRLAADGTTILLVSHFLDEVLAVSDRITVLRDGAHVVTDDADRLTSAELVRHMVGRQIDVLYPTPRPVPDDAPVRLRATGVSRRRHPGRRPAGPCRGDPRHRRPGRQRTQRDAAATVRRRPRHLGRDRGGWHAARSDDPARAMRAGVALVPESRKEQGLVLGRSVRENIALASLSRRTIGPLVRRGNENSAVAKISKAVDIRAAQPGRPDPNAVRRQPTEGAVREVVVARAAGPADRRTDPRRRHRGQVSHPPTRRRPRRRGSGGGHRLLGDRGAAGALAPRAGAPAADAWSAEFDRGTPRETVIAAAFGDRNRTPADPATMPPDRPPASPSAPPDGTVSIPERRPGREYHYAYPGPGGRGYGVAPRSDAARGCATTAS